MHRTRTSNRPAGISARSHGISIFYLIFFMVAGSMLCSLAVDYGRVQLAKTELRSAADAAARAGALTVLTSTSQARADAIATAAANKTDGTPVVLASSDVDTGNWTNNSFTLNGTPANAVRIRAARSAAAGNGIPLLFARVLGPSNCNVTAGAIAYGTAGQPRGFIGLSGIAFKNNLYVGSYDSSTNKTPNSGNATTVAMLGSNGAIKGSNNNELYGTALLGPSATVSGLSVYGTTSVRSSDIPKPSSPAWNPGINPGGTPQNYTVNSNTTLIGGSYWFTSLTINNTLRFSGPTTLYVSGDITIGGTIQPTSLIPSDLTIYQIGSHTFGDASSNGMDVVAVVSAPDSTFTAKNNLYFRGSAIFGTISAMVKNSGGLYYDTALGDAMGSVTVRLVQ